jgi:hypothetical protein
MHWNKAKALLQRFYLHYRPISPRDVCLMMASAIRLSRFMQFVTGGVLIQPG